MFSFSGRQKKILTSALVFSLLVSAYVMLIPIIGLLNQTDLIESLALFDCRNSTSTEFHVGDTLIVVAEVKGASVYFLTINDHTDTVLSNSGGVHESRVEVHVPLYPPEFKAHLSYSVVLVATSFNNPLPGVTVSDKEVAVFTVFVTGTKLKLDAGYLEDNHQLSLDTLLTNGNDGPLANQRVDFYLQPNGNISRRNRGWIPLGSSNTNTDGVASLNLATNLISGCHYLKAEYKENEDFEGSFDEATFVVKPSVPLIQVAPLAKRGGELDVAVKVTNQHGYPLLGKTVMVEFEASTEKKTIYGVTDGDGEFVTTLKELQDQGAVEAWVTLLGDCFSSETRTKTTIDSDRVGPSTAFESTNSPSGFMFESSGNGGSIDVQISPEEPYAILPSKVTATYYSTTLYDWFNFTFLLDGADLLAEETPANVTTFGEGYNYTAELLWCPEVLSFHSIHVIGEGGVEDPPSSIQETGRVDFNVLPCPSNIVVYSTQESYGNTTLLTVAFSRPRTYQSPDASSYCYSYNLAPKLNYSNVSYATDQGIESALVKVYKNGSLIETLNVTDGNGITDIPINLNLSDTYDTLNITVFVFPPLYANRTREQITTYTKVHVNEATTGGSEYFQLNYTITNPVQGQEAYVAVENQIETNSTIFDLGIWNIPVSTIAAKFIASDDTFDFGWTWIPTGSDYLRIMRQLGGDRVLFLPSGDCNGDGIVDVVDEAIVRMAWDTTPEHPMWDPRADLNNDESVDDNDLYIISIHWHETSEWSYVDGEGCAKIPSGAERVAVYKGYQPTGDTVDFFDITLEQTSQTDNLGTVSQAWNPAEIGTYLVQVKLPSSFDTVLSFMSDVTQLDVDLNVVNYVNVTKRPIGLSVGHSFSQPARQEEIELLPDADSYVYSWYPDLNYGDWDELMVGVVQFVGDLWYYRSYLKFDISFIPREATISSAILRLFHKNSDPSYVNGTIKVHRVLSSWGENNLTWLNQPSYNSTPTASVNVEGGGGEYWDLDVVTDVQVWHNGNAANHGFMVNSSELEIPQWIMFSSREWESVYPCVLNLTYTIPANVTLVTDAFDEGAGEPASALPVEFFVDGNSIGTADTNSTGTATKSWVSSSSAVYNVTVISSENATLEAANSTLILDLRVNTSLGLWRDDINPIENYGDINVSTFTSNEFVVQIRPRLIHVDVKLYVNGTYDRTLVTNSYGRASFSWTATEIGVYDFRLVFEGLENHKPCEFLFVALAEASPVSLYFDVSPKQFKPGDRLTLWAKAVHAVTNSPLEGVRLQFFKDNTSLIAEDDTNQMGVFSTTWNYPNDGAAHTVHVVVDSEMSVGDIGLVTQPVTLKVGKSTSIVLTAERQHSSINHTISGRLTSDSTPLNDKTIKLKIRRTLVSDQPHGQVSQTEYTLTTNSDGRFSLTLNLQPPSHGTAIYEITATLEGDQPKSAVALATTPNGTQYIICTTIQHEYKSSLNRISFDVEAPVTEVVTPEESTVTEEPDSTSVEVPPPKTPEEMQAEAEQEGWLQIWHEFIWWYPWYRIHFISKPFGIMEYDLGISLLPFADSLKTAKILIQKITDFLQSVTLSIVLAVAGGEFTGLLASQTGPVGFLVALAVSLATKWGSYSSNYNSVKGLISAYIGSLFSTVLGLLKMNFDLVFGFIKLLLQIKSLAEFGFGKLYSIISIPINIAYQAVILHRLDDLGAF